MRIGAGIDLPALAARPMSSLWNYDLTQGTLPPVLSVARASTGTRVNSSGLIVTEALNTPRFDYLLGTCRGLLIEPQATYFCQRSGDVAVSPWALSSGLTNTAVTADSPLGIGDSINRLGGGSQSFASDAIGLTPTASTMTQHWIIRNYNAVATRIVYRDSVTTTQINASFTWASATELADIVSMSASTGAGVTCTATSYTHLGNGWWLVTATFVTAALNSAAVLRIDPAQTTIGRSVDIAAAWATYTDAPQSYAETTTSPITRAEDMLTLLDASRPVEFTYEPLSGGALQTVIVPAQTQPVGIYGRIARVRQL